MALCGGCAERAAAMRGAMSALADGDTAELTRQIEKFNASAIADVRNVAGAVRDTARARLGIRR